MLVISQDQSCAALLGDYLQTVAPARFVGFVFFFPQFMQLRLHARIQKGCSCCLPCVPDWPRTQGEGGRLPVCSSSAPQQRKPTTGSAGQEHGACLVAPSCSMAKARTEALSKWMGSPNTVLTWPQG